MKKTEKYIMPILIIIALIVLFSIQSNQIKEVKKDVALYSEITLENKSNPDKMGTLNDANKNLEEIHIILNELQRTNDKLVKENSELKEMINSLPIDKDLHIKLLAEEWLLLLSNKQYFDIEFEKVKEIMGVSPSNYLYDYSFYESEESIERLDFMLDVVFQDGEAFEIHAVNYNNGLYILEDTDENKFEIWSTGDTVGSIWAYANFCYKHMENFVEALISRDIDSLRGLYYYETYDSDAEIESYLYEEYIDGFDLSTIGFSFIGVDLDGFKFELYDKKGNYRYVHINHNDGFPAMK